MQLFGRKVSNLCFVIALDKSPRNPKIFEQIERYIPDADIRLIAGLTPAQIPNEKIFQYQVAAQRLLGRSVTPEEIACSLSHNLAQRTAANTNSSSTFIFEDDAYISGNQNIESFLVDPSMGFRPTVVTFYGGKWSIWMHARDGARALIPPAGAVAYWLNMNALKIVASRDPIGLADWPTWSSDVVFRLSHSLEVECLEGPSTVRVVGQDSPRTQIAGKTLGSLHKSKFSPSFLDIIRYRYIYPLLWKALRKLNRLPREGTTVHDNSIYLFYSRKNAR